MSGKFGRISFGTDSDDENFSEAETVTISSESSDNEGEEEQDRKETGTQVTYRDLPRKKRSSNTGTVRRVITRSQSRAQDPDISLPMENGAPAESDTEENVENETVNEPEEEEFEVDRQENEHLLEETEVFEPENENSPKQELLEDTEVCQPENENGQVFLEETEVEEPITQREETTLQNVLDAANSLQSTSLTETLSSETSQKVQKNDLTVNISGTLEDGSTVQPVSILIQRDSDVGTINIRLGSLSVQSSECSVNAETLAVPSTSYQSFNESSLPKMDDTKLSSSTVKAKDQSKVKKMSSKEKKKKASKKVKKGRKHRSRRSTSSSYSSTSSSFSSSDYESTSRCYYRVGARCSSDSSSEYSSFSSSEEECTCRKSKASSKKETRKNKK